MAKTKPIVPLRGGESFSEAANDEVADAVTIKRFCDLTGISDPTVRGWIRGREIKRGVHYFKRGRTILLKYSAVINWFEDDLK